MNNLYVFAIGGSGERVLRSLVLMLASGVSVRAQRIVPVFVDNDVDSNALTKCKDLINYYNSDPHKGGKVGANTVYSNLTNRTEEWPSFFKTIIENPIILNKAGKSIGNLQGIIGNVDPNNPVCADIAEERDLLFTQDDLQMPLSVGFVGNPNIGSVVLNSLSLSDDEFGTIKTATADDGVFVVGSLFGGTGAAGLPLIINTFNAKPQNERPLLGGVAILPYFGLEEKDGTQGVIDTTKWDVNADSFDTKTRAALMYYDDYMRDMDYLYYVGDGDAKDIYEHYVGGKKQENPAHLVEVMAALSIVDFSKQHRQNATVVYKSPVWGINTSTASGENSLPTNLSGVVNVDLKKSLIKFEMMKQLFYNSNFLEWAIKEKKDFVHNIGFTEDMRLAIANKNKVENFEFAWGVSHLIEEWSEWMDELGRKDRKRKFLIYDDNDKATDANITSKFYTETDTGIAKVIEHKTGLFGFGGKEYVPLDASVAKSMQKAYKALFPRGNANDAMRIEDAKKLPVLLQIISKALDDVIDNKCISM